FHADVATAAGASGDVTLVGPPKQDRPVDVAGPRVQRTAEEAIPVGCRDHAGAMMSRWRAAPDAGHADAFAAAYRRPSAPGIPGGRLPRWRGRGREPAADRRRVRQAAGPGRRAHRVV